MIETPCSHCKVGSRGNYTFELLRKNYARVKQARKIFFHNYYNREERLNPTPLKQKVGEFLSLGES